MLTRLLHMTEAGDLDAAGRLWIEARRAGEHALAGLAAAVLGDLDGVVAMLDALIDAGDVQGVERLGERVGVRLDGPTWRHLEALRAQTNAVCLRQVRAHVLDREDMLRAVLEARHGKPCWSVSTGAPERIGHAAVCLVVRRPDGVLTTGFTVTAYGFGAATPAAWDELDDWSDGDEQDQMRLMRWASNTRAPDRMQMRSTPVRSALRPRSRLELLAGELDQLLGLPPLVGVFDRIVEVLLSVASVDPDAIHGFVERTDSALADWPDAMRWIAMDAFDDGLPEPIAALARQASALVSSRADLRRVAQIRSLSRCRELSLALTTPEVTPSEVMRAGLSLVERCDVRTLELQTGMTPGACLHHPRPATLEALRLHADRAIVHQVRDPLLLDGLACLHVSGPGTPRPSEVLDRDALDVLLSSPRVSALRELELVCCPGGLDAVQASPYLGALRALTARGPGVDDESIAQLGRRRRPGLTKLVLGLGQVGPEAVRGLVDGPTAQTIETLHLLDHRITDRGCALLACHALDALTELALVGDRRHTRDAPLGRYGATALATAPWLEQVRLLDLSHNPLGDLGLAALLDGRTPQRLETLVLRDCGITVDGLEHLAASPALPALRRLMLDFNPLAASARDLRRARALVERSWLRDLDLVELWRWAPAPGE